jgi:imidazolonepropionase-like amidohydrolase
MGLKLRDAVPALVSLLLFFTLTANAGDDAVPAVAFRNVTVLDMRSEKPRPGMTVLIRGDRIAGIGKELKIPERAKVIDGNGKFLIPGLWDNYTFTLDAVAKKLPYFELLVAHGVTGVRDAGTSMNPAEAARLRNEISAGRLVAPRVFLAGPVLIGEMPPRPSNRWGANSMVVKTAEEATKAVDSLARAGVDHIKTEKRVAPELLSAIIKEAHKHQLRVAGVPPSFLDDASKAGLDCVEHFAELHRATSNKREEYYAMYRDHTVDTMTADQNYAFFNTMETDQPYYEETLQILARNKTFVCTNAAMFATFISEFELADTSRRRFNTKAELAEVQKAVAEHERQKQTADYRGSAKSREKTLRNIADLQRAGVPLLAGTQLNSQSVGTPGAVLHDELQIFVQAGLSPFQALQAATVNPAKFMKREKDLGTIEAGKLADLVLLDANPLDDIANTRRINAVVVNGRLLTRDHLDEMLNKVAERAKE